MPHRIVTLAACLVLLSAVAGISAEFLPLGFPAATGLVRDSLAASEDGSVVAGSTFSPDRIVRWTRSTGPEDLLLQGDSYGPAVGISGDGSIIVSAEIHERNLGADPVRFTDAELTVLPTPPDFFFSVARVISQDGSTIWGDGNPRGERGGMLRWTDDGVTFFPYPDRSYSPAGVSANGKTFVGTVCCSGLAAFRWTEEGGFQELPALGRGERESYWGWGVSSNGRWTVGRSELGTRYTQYQGSRWDGFASPERLLPAQEGWGTAGLDVTANGSVVVGRVYLSDETLDRYAGIAAGIWTEELGVMVSLQDLLVSHYGLGPKLTGYHLTGVYDVTDDGRFMVGHMIGPDWQGDDLFGEAFLVDLGLRGDFNGDEALDIHDLDALASAKQTGQENLSFDLDYSYTVDLTDQQIWVQELKGTWFGDANLDGQFDSGDLVSVFQAGQYERRCPELDVGDRRLER